MVLKAPKDWSLVAVTGDEKKGYFRVDSPRSTSAEVRWIEVKSPPDIEARTKDFLRQLEKANKKRKMPFTWQVKPRKQTKIETATGGSSVGFTWRGDRNGYGRLLYCPTCRRVVIAQIVSPLGEDASGVAGELLGTVCDHQDPEWQMWALYDLQVSLPSDYRLVKHSLMSSYIMLSFKSKDAELIVERWGLANTLLKRSGMEDWFRKDSLPDYGGFKLEIKPEDVRGHEGLEVLGRRYGIRQMVRTAARSLTLRPLPQELTTYAWHCTESNRLFAVRVVRDDGGELIGEVMDRIACH